VTFSENAVHSDEFMGYNLRSPVGTGCFGGDNNYFLPRTEVRSAFNILVKSFLAFGPWGHSRTDSWISCRENCIYPETQKAFPSGITLDLGLCQAKIPQTLTLIPASFPQPLSYN